jgi:hypothetical protein
MLKLGIFGDQTSNAWLMEQLNGLPEVGIEGVYFSGNVPVPDGFNEFFSPVALMDRSDAILILNEKSISADLIRLILRKSKHIYLRSIPVLSNRDLKELIDLEKEAGIVNYIYNPFDFIRQFNLFRNKNEKPVLISLRTCFEGAAIKPASELLLLVTAINRIVQSNHKKTEVLGLNYSNGQLVVNIRIEYENSSVVCLTISSEKTPGFCEVFCKERITFELPSPLYPSNADFNQELTAIGDFIRIITQKDKQASSFDSLLNGTRIVNEIAEQLRFNEIEL